jgi:hypothetical protein
MLRQEFDEVMLRTLAGKENERIFLGDGVEIDTATNEIELGEKLAVCIMLKVRYPAHARKTKGVYAILPRRKDDIEPKRFKSTAIHLEGPAINVHEFFKPDPRRRLYVLVSAKQNNFRGVRPSVPDARLVGER